MTEEINSAVGTPEIVALYLLASIAANEAGTAVNVRQGVPIIAGKSKDWILENYADCIKTITTRKAHI